MATQKRIQRGAQAFGFEIRILNFRKVRVCNKFLGSGSFNSNQVHLVVGQPRRLVLPLVEAVVYTILNHFSIISSINLLENSKMEIVSVMSVHNYSTEHSPQWHLVETAKSGSSAAQASPLGSCLSLPTIVTA